MKKILIALGVMVIGVIVLLVIGVSNIGPLIKKAVNTMGPEITKTAVRLEDISVSIFTGEVKLEDFVLGNPKGFSTPVAMRVNGVSVDLDEESITDNPIVINKIEIIKPEITYEKKGGTDNFEVILANITKRIKSEKGGGEKAQKKEGEKPGKTLLIKHVIVKDGMVTLAMDLIGGQSISAPLPDIHLTDIGKGSNGVTPAQAVEVIVDALYTDINADSVTKIFNDGLNNLGIVADIHKEGGQAAEQAVDTVGSALESAVDGIGGLFKSD